jgi:hypothetical protein
MMELIDGQTSGSTKSGRTEELSQHVMEILNMKECPDFACQMLSFALGVAPSDACVRIVDRMKTGCKSAIHWSKSL